MEGSIELKQAELHDLPHILEIYNQGLRIELPL